MRFTEIKSNGVIFGTMAFIAGGVSATVLGLGWAFGWEMPNEAIILLVSGVIGPGVALVGMGTLAMAPDPPNPHQAHMDHEFRMEQIEFEKFKIEQGVVEVEDEA